MKYFMLLLLLSVMEILLSCKEDPVKALPAKSSNTIILIDSSTYLPIDGYAIEIYSELEGKYIAESKQILLYPNPILNNSTFIFENKYICNLDLNILNIITGKESKLFKYQAIMPGQYEFSFNLTDSTAIDYGLYQALLKRDGIVSDSLNFLYCSDEQYNLVTNAHLFQTISKLSDLNGTLVILENINKLPGKSFNMTAENGQILGGFIFTNNFRICIYDKNNLKVLDVIVSIDLINNGIIIKI